MKRIVSSVLSIGFLLASGVALASGAIHWTYSGEEGPDNWARLSPEYSACAGKNQSPINLAGFIEADLKPIDLSYQPGGSEILNNGHTVQVNYAPGSTITVDGTPFALKQFHFHAPSENHIDGKSYALEGHLVHADKDGNLAVIALMYNEGAESKALAQIWAALPEKADTKGALSAAFDATQLLPAKRDYYRFNGSLTTPPCTEGVRWLVMKEPLTVSKQQIEQFSHAMGGHPNNRPVQTVNARPVLQ